MTTARERYEAKTKVVTFRVAHEEYHQLEEVKVKTGLSNADLIKLGAGIAEAEIKAKLTEASGLESRLAQLKAAIRRAQQELDRYISEERKRRLAELDKQIEAFKLFERGWGLEEASFKLAIPQPKAFDYFQEWSEERKEKQAAERELLRACTRLHIQTLKDRIAWLAFRPPDSYQDELKEIQMQIHHCQHLLSAPGEINTEWRELLLAEYSAKVLQAKPEKSHGNTA